MSSDRIRRNVLAGLLLCLATPGGAAAQCNGNLDLVPVNLPANIVRFRRAMQVVANVSTNPSFKILFDNVRLAPAPPGLAPYFLSSDIFSARFVHPDGVCTTWPPIGTWHHGQSMLHLNLDDYPNYQQAGTGKAGIKTTNPTLFPRETIEVDGLPGLWSRGAEFQANVNGIRFVVDVARAGLVTDTSGWQCNGTLPAGSYREWTSTVHLDGGCDPVSQSPVRFVAPAANAQYLGPFDFSTEFFTSSPGLFKVYLSDLEVQTEGSGTWTKLCRWRLASQCGAANEYGVKLSTDGAGRNVIEISNDGPANGGPGGFMAVGTEFTIPGCS